MLLTLLACIPKSTPPADTPSTQRIRVATYNASLFGDTPTDVLDRLQEMKKQMQDIQMHKNGNGIMDQPLK